MSYETLELTRQAATAHWGWTIAFFLWFVGLAGMGLFVNYWVKSRRLFTISTIAVVVGTLLVVSHLTRILNLPMAAINAILEWKLNFGSWMFIGICILAATCVVTVLQALGIAKGCKTCEGDGMRVLDAVLGVAATAYSGFLLTQAEGVALWTTSLLPILWLISGLACALGAVEVLSATKKLECGHLSWLSGVANGVHVLEAIALFAFLQVALSGTPGAAAGAHSMLSGDTYVLFWGGAVGLGIVIPLLINAFAKKCGAAAVIGGLAAIVGALCLRAAVLFAGYYDPILF